MGNKHTHTVTERGTPSQAPRATLEQLGAWFVLVSTPALGIAASLQGKTIADAIGVRGNENGPKEKGKEKGQGRGRPASRGEAQRRGAPHTRGGKETGPEKHPTQGGGGKKARREAPPGHDRKKGKPKKPNNKGGGRKRKNLEKPKTKGRGQKEKQTQGEAEASGLSPDGA